ncbi:hypothetical protein IWW48_003748 [Coemansia sp. RSA 1200]|nr:hypothetical protein IWW48_003748 [Coemansia sp. RSA 1200]
MMATVASLQQHNHPGVARDHAKHQMNSVYGGGTVRSISSDSTASVSSATGSANISWVRSKKRDWDNAFLTKYQDFESTLHENDKWLAIYWQNIAGMRDTKRSAMAITEALKTSSSKRRVRSRMDVRDVFAGSISSAASSNGTLQLSPYSAHQNTRPRAPKRRGPYYGSTQGTANSNTLSMAIAGMPMLPPKSPYLSSSGMVVSPPSAATTLASASGMAGSAADSAATPPPTATTAVASGGVRKKDIANVPSLRAQRSQESALAHKVVEMRRQPSGTLVRSNSAVARAAAAIKQLQGSADTAQQQQQPDTATVPGAQPQASQGEEGEEEERPATPDHVTGKSQQQQRFAPRTTVPTLRDMILYRQSPSKPPTHSRQRTPPLTATNIDMALGSLSLDAASRKQKPDAYYSHAQPQPDPAAGGNNQRLATPPRLAAPGVAKANPHPRTVSNASSQGSADTTRSEEDMRERLQRIRIALGRTNAGPGARAADEEAEAEEEDALQRIDRIEAALSPDSVATAADITALYRDIDEVESMLQSSIASPVAESRHAEEAEEEHRGIGDASADASSDEHHGAARTSPGKRKHSDDEKAQQQQQKAPPAAATAKGRGRGKGRGAALHAVQQQQSSGIPRRPAGAASASRAPAAAAAVPPRTHSRVPLSASGRVAEARRRFDAPAAPFASPVTAMRPGHSSMSATALSGSGGVAKRPHATALAASSRPHATAGAKPAAKSSTAAMREAARKAEAIRAHAAAAAASARRPVVAAKARAPQPPPSQASRALGRSASARSAAAKPAAPRPAPLSTDSSDGGASTSGSDDDRRRGAKTQPTAVPIPIPAAAGAKKSGKSAVDSTASSSSAAESADSAGGRWGGVASMLAMLSPSSWKSQSGENEEEGGPPPAEHETPTGAGARRSPYDVASPQTPYQPRPEHASARSRLVMPAYRDVAVPLRRSSGAASTASEASAGAPRRTSRVSGVSSLFSDDSVSVRQPSLGGGPAHWPGSSTLTRAKSASDLGVGGGDMVTPMQQGARRLAQQRKSSARSEEYTSIVPLGSDSPPEIESDYSDEYSDEEFSPAPRRKKNDFRIPKWATTPELAKGLQRQERVNPDRIFGRVKPLRVTDVFSRNGDADGSQRRKPRNSSMIWSGADALTADEELDYIRRMGFE